MYTQCPRCETVFRVSAEVLRAAGGQVRCGRCGEIFSALARLAEDPAAFALGETSLDLEVRADAILESGRQGAGEAPPPSVAQAPADAGDDAELEFTLPPGELDRIFIESHPKLPELDDLERIVAESGPDPTITLELEDIRSIGYEVPEAVRRDMIEARREPAAEPAAPPAAPPVETVAESAGDSLTTLLREPEGKEEASWDATPRKRVWPWAALTAALALLLAGQIAADRLDWLEAQSPFGPALRSLLARVGLPAAQETSLAAYQLRQWGVTGAPEGAGTLRVRASVLNASAQLVPYPLLRVTLLNRFGARVGTRDFAPAEYVGKPVARMLAPGERVDATVSILDPGKDAEGFEIDVCLRRPDQRVVCAADGGAQGGAK